MRKKPVLMIAWLAICGGSAGLLLHPAIPDLLRSVVQKPGRLMAETIEYGAHVGVFFVATQLALICFEATTLRRRVAVLGAASLLGIAAEPAQRWVPTRGVDPFDALCNIAGVALAAVVYKRLFSGALAEPTALPS